MKFVVFSLQDNLERRNLLLDRGEVPALGHESLDDVWILLDPGGGEGSVLTSGGTPVPIAVIAVGYLVVVTLNFISQGLLIQKLLQRFEDEAKVSHNYAVT